MAVSVTSQFHIFLLSLLAGALAGVFFDMFRAFRRLVRAGTVWVGVQDILYWLLSAAAAFFFLYHFNYGQPRWYIFCGILLGALFYHLLLGDRMVRLFLALVRLLGTVLRFLARVLVFPFLLLYRIFRPILLFFWRPLRRIGRFFRRKTRAFVKKLSFGAKKFKKRLKMY